MDNPSVEAITTGTNGARRFRSKTSAALIPTMCQSLAQAQPSIVPEEIGQEDAPVPEMLQASSIRC